MSLHILSFYLITCMTYHSRRAVSEVSVLRAEHGMTNHRSSNGRVSAHCELLLCSPSGSEVKA